MRSNTSASQTCGLGVLGLQLLQGQLELIGKQGQALGRLAKLHPPQASQHDRELLDLERGKLDDVLRRVEFLSGHAVSCALGFERLFRRGEPCLHIGVLGQIEHVRRHSFA